MEIIVMDMVFVHNDSGYLVNSETLYEVEMLLTVQGKILEMRIYCQLISLKSR